MERAEETMAREDRMRIIIALLGEAGSHDLVARISVAD